MSSQDSSSGGSGFNGINQNVFGLTALIVSLVALFTTTLQVLQQYFSSAEGYRRCAESVMGLWSKGTRRKLRWREFRVEVVFETPVMFTAAPDNKNGPIKGRDIYYIDGTKTSYENTRVLMQRDQEAASRATTERVHTADDERASWVALLSTLQNAEANSRKWDKEQRERLPPRTRTIKPPAYELTVGLQYKTRSWDFIPSSITKPYATTAICHLIEMMAMLGLYWKVFDESIWNLRAEGNGFILTSTTVQGLGVMVVFSTTGRSAFEERRVIPCHSIKELSFGTVPNIFENIEYLERESDAQSLSLVFGSHEDVSDTLEAIGCSANTIELYKKDHKHIFSVSFEIIGMLSKVFRPRGSAFRLLPNPTSDLWLRKPTPNSKASWRIVRLMEVFQDRLSAHIYTHGYSQSHQITKISEDWKAISELGCLDETNLSVETSEAIHDALDSRTKYLLSIPQASVLGVLVSHITVVMSLLAVPTSTLNTIILAHKEDALIGEYFNRVRPDVVGEQDETISDEEKDKRNTVWLSLIFRMLCWLLLHDFDKADVKIVPSDLKGSRMPVYIG